MIRPPPPHTITPPHRPPHKTQPNPMIKLGYAALSLGPSMSSEGWDRT